MFSVYCLALYFELNNHKTDKENKRDVTNTGNGERGTGNGERGTGNGERGTGNGSLGTSVQR